MPVNLEGLTWCRGNGRKNTPTEAVMNLRFLIEEASSNMDWIFQLKASDIPSPEPYYQLDPGQALYMIGIEDELARWLWNSNRTYPGVSRMAIPSTPFNVETSDQTQLGFVTDTVVKKGVKRELRNAANLALQTVKRGPVGFLTGVNLWHHGHKADVAVYQVYNATNATDAPHGTGLQTHQIDYATLGSILTLGSTPGPATSYVVHGPKNPFRRKYHKVRTNISY
jgi:hypothetical protein